MSGIALFCLSGVRLAAICSGRPLQHGVSERRDRPIDQRIIAPRPNTSRLQHKKAPVATVTAGMLLKSGVITPSKARSTLMI